MKYITFPTQTYPPTVFVDHITHMQYDGATTLNIYLDSSDTPVEITVSDSDDANAMLNQICKAANSNDLSLSNIYGINSGKTPPYPHIPPVGVPFLYPNFGSLWMFFVGKSNISYYNLYASVDSGASYYKIAKLPYTATSPFYIDTVQTGVSMKYALASVSLDGHEGEMSAALSGTPLVLSIAEGVGQNVLSWGQFTYASGSTSYRITRWNDGFIPTYLATVTDPTLTYTDSDVVAGTKYNYYVQCENNGTGKKITSPQSNVVSGTPS